MTSTTLRRRRSLTYVLFFFNAPATTEIYTLSLHDALPISRVGLRIDRDRIIVLPEGRTLCEAFGLDPLGDRKSTRLNSSHQIISYAVFCLKKKNQAAGEARPPQCDQTLSRSPCMGSSYQP